MKLILFEDEHLLVVEKPAGVNTHAPGPFANEGIYELFRHRSPAYARLAILHRLDKETSGVLVFGKSSLANKSLHDQFLGRQVKKTYWLLATGKPPAKPLDVRSALVRSGNKYLSRPPHAGADLAETRFRALSDAEICGAGLPKPAPHQHWLAAEPITGRTHQIRVQAAQSGFPIVGDALYGGADAERLYLHAAEIRLEHPLSGPQVFRAPFSANASEALREALIDTDATDTFRLIHGASDSFPGWYVERYGDWLLSSSASPLSAAQQGWIASYCGSHGLRGAYHKHHARSVRGARLEEASPQHLWGEPAPERFEVRENGLSFEISFREGYSVGIFLDQRENRRRMRDQHVAAEFPLDLTGCEVLNTFAYTCGFSVAAARAGARVTSLDLSRKYLDWGKRNFALNGLDPAGHDFIFGDVFDWLKRLGRKGRRYGLVILDPPTFSQSKESGVFRVQKDYARLVEAAAGVLSPGGVLLASTNAADWAPEAFLEAVEAGLTQAGRRITQQHYAPQPLDFPISLREPGYLKTAWFRV